eukprot:s645_g19.t1
MSSLHSTSSLAPAIVSTRGEENQSVSEVFAGLKDFKSLTRERSLETLIQALKEGRYVAEEVQKLALETMDSDAWEAKRQGKAGGFLTKNWGIGPIQVVTYNWDNWSHRTGNVEIFRQHFFDETLKMNNS